MKPLVQQLKVKYSSKIPVIEYNLDSQESIAQADKYGVLYVPTLVFIDSSNKVKNKLVGSVDIATLEKNMQNITK